MPDVERIKDESIELPNAYRSWLEYWETVQNQQATNCCNSRCLERAELGCLVEIKQRKKPSLLLCAHCAQVTRIRKCT